MANYLRRLLFLDRQTRINPLLYPFLWATGIYGLGFAFLGHWSGVSSSSLYTAFALVHHWLPALWGFAAVLATILAIALMLTRYSGHLGHAAALLGFLVWVFAGCIYAINGYWLVMLTVAAPNIYFWAFYYLRVKWYETTRRTGELQDP